MISFNFKHSIKYNEHEVYTIDTLHLNPRYLFQKTNKIPFIFCFYKAKYGRDPEGLKFDIRTQANTQLKIIDTATIFEIFQNGSDLVLVHARGRYYYVGKGIICNSEGDIICMITVTNSFYNDFDPYIPVTDVNISKHFTLRINIPLIQMPINSHVYRYIKRFYSSLSFSVYYTHNIVGDIFLNTQLPNFSTQDEQSEYLNKVKEEFIQDFLTSQV